jgi:hypothetical protein
MSSYTIYRSEGIDPIKYGRNKRALLSSLTIGSPTCILLINSSLLTGVEIPVWVGIGLVSILFVFMIGVYVNMYKTRKRITQIGELTLSSSGILSNISGIEDYIPLENMNEISLHKHLPGGLFSSGKYGYFSYILKIQQRNGLSQSYILSSSSTNGSIDLKTNLDFLRKKNQIQVTYSL